MTKRPEVILLVDDSPEDRTLYRRFLADAPEGPFEFHEASTAAEAVELAAKTKPACILLDVGLPDRSGLDLLAEWGGETGLPPYPVVMMTGAGDDRTDQSATRAGAQDYIEKDHLTRDALARVVRRAIDRQRLVAAIRESEAKFRAFFELCPEPIVVTRPPEYTILEANPALVALSGYGREELLGRSANEFWPGDVDADEMRAMIARAGARRSSEVVLMGRHGKRIVALMSVARIEWDDAPANLVFLRDIGERREAERTQALLASIVATTSDAVVSTDVEGRIVTWNEAAAELYGYPEGEAQGAPVIDLLVPEDRKDEERELMTAVLRGENPGTREIVRSRKDGSLVDVVVTVSPVRDREGRVVGASSIGHDIGRRKEVERLRQDLVAMMSHDLKTPLSVVLGATDLLRESGTFDEESADLVDMIEANTRRAITMAFNLVDAARIDEGTLTARISETDLEEIFRGVLHEQATVSRTRAVTIETEPLPRVLVDPRLIDRVMTNLLSNAIKFSPNGGVIRVRRVRENGMTGFRIEDQGPGVPPDQREFLFQRFAVLSTSQAKSSGLGLFIVRHFVDAMGGQVRYEDAPGGGAAFIVTFPEAR